MSGKLFVVSRFIAKEDKIDRLYEELNSLLEPTRTEPSCISYDLYRSKDNPRLFTMIEKFENEEAGEFHCSQPYLAAFREIVKSLTDSISIELYSEADTP